MKCYDWEPYTDYSRIILRLSCISARWRAVMLAESSLWVWIHLGWPHGQQNTWLERANQRSLDIVVNFHGVQLLNEQEYRHIVTINGNIVQQSNRWRSFYVKDYTHMALNVFIKPHIWKSITSFPSLKSISLHASEITTSAEAFPTPLPWFPKLVTLEATGCIPVTKGIPPSLRRLQLHRMMFDLIVLRSCLLACRSLHHLDIGGIYEPEELSELQWQLDGKAEFFLPNLQTLSLVTDDVEYSAPYFVFSLIGAPALEQLIINGNGFPSGNQNTELFTCFDRFSNFVCTYPLHFQQVNTRYRS